MPNCYPVFSLPFLHKELAELGNTPLFLPKTIKYIWPGLANMPEDLYWTSPDYVFDSVMAKQCMKDLDAMGDAAMTGVPVHSLILMDMDKKENKKKQELNDLRNFAQNGLIPSDKSDLADMAAPKAKDNKTIFVAAQKILLWAWLLEEKTLEMRDLMDKYKGKATSTIDPLFVDAESGMDTLLKMEYELDDGALPLPSWQFVLENAAVFLPDNSVIIVSCSKMSSDLQEKLDFQKGTAAILEKCAENFIDKYNIIQSQSFVWKALGRKSKENKQYGLDKSFTFIILRGLNESVSSE